MKRHKSDSGISRMSKTLPVLPGHILSLAETLKKVDLCTAIPLMGGTSWKSGWELESKISRLCVFHSSLKILELVRKETYEEGRQRTVKESSESGNNPHSLQQMNG